MHDKNVILKVTTDVVMEADRLILTYMARIEIESDKR